MPGLGEGAGLGSAGVLRPLGIGGRTVRTLDPGRLSEDGDTTAGSSSAPEASEVWPDVTKDGIRFTITKIEIYQHILRLI